MGETSTDSFEKVIEGRSFYEAEKQDVIRVYYGWRAEPGSGAIGAETARGLHSPKRPSPCDTQRINTSARWLAVRKMAIQRAAQADSISRTISPRSSITAIIQRAPSLTVSLQRGNLIPYQHRLLAD